MTSVILNFPENLLTKMLGESQSRGVTLETFILEAMARSVATPDTCEMKAVSIEVILDKALKEAQKLPVGESFFVKDLCSQADWACLGAGERKVLGKYFRKKAENMAKPIAKWIGRTSSNQAIYEKV